MRFSEMLGVRRAGITQAAGELQESDMIEHSRGHITVVERSQLEARVCACYAVF